jgi:hypothetical protein
MHAKEFVHSQDSLSSSAILYEWFKALWQQEVKAKAELSTPCLHHAHRIPWQKEIYWFQAFKDLSDQL